MLVACCYQYWSYAFNIDANAPIVPDDVYTRVRRGCLKEEEGVAYFTGMLLFSLGETPSLEQS